MLDPHSWKSTQRYGFTCILGLSFSTSDLKQVSAYLLCKGSSVRL